MRAYKVKSWDGPVDFLTQLARNSGKLLRGGEPDLNTAARMVLYDWQRGKIPYFALPPDYQDKGSALDKARKPSQAVTVSSSQWPLDPTPSCPAKSLQNSGHVHLPFLLTAKLGACD